MLPTALQSNLSNVFVRAIDICLRDLWLKYFTCCSLLRPCLVYVRGSGLKVKVHGHRMTTVLFSFVCRWTLLVYVFCGCMLRCAIFLVVCRVICSKVVDATLCASYLHCIWKNDTILACYNFDLHDASTDFDNFWHKCCQGSSKSNDTLFSHLT